MKKGIALMAALITTVGAAEFNLVDNGQAQVRIVYHNAASVYPTPAATQEQRLAATIADFCDIVKRISGADLVAVAAAEAGDESAGSIQIGMTPAALAAGLAERLRGQPAHTYLIHADPAARTLFLVGSTLEGSGHAVYAFLERLGCRWYMPGGLGERLPLRATISVGELDVRQAPAFELRAIQLRAKGSAASGTQTRDEVMTWMRRNKFGGYGPARGHQFATIVPEQKHFATHPEFYALRDGERRTSHLCMTNPAVLDAAEAFLTEYFTAQPTAMGYPVALADGAQFCECPACTEACGGNARQIMPLYLKFTGALFDRIDRKFPGREFQYGFYVYSNLMAVPKGRIPKQLAPYIAPLGYDAFHTVADPARYRKLSVYRDFPSATKARIEADPRSDPARLVNEVIEAWGDGTDNLYLRDYDPYITFAQNVPLLRTYQLAIEIPWHKEIGVRGYTPEATANSWFTSGINFWVRSRLYWDTGADIKEIMTGYCQGMFGAAWEPMYQVIDAFSRRTIESTAYRHGDHVLARLYSLEWIADLDVFLDQAEGLAVTPESRAAVNMWRLCQQLTSRYLRTRQAESNGDFVNAAALGDDYVRFLDYVSTVDPHFVDPRWYAEREFSMQTMARQYHRYAARLNGAEGRFILALPTHWWFRYDPTDIGLQDAWYRGAAVPGYEPPEGMPGAVAYPPLKDWRLQATEQSWQRSDAEYDGYNWYRTQVRIPASLAGGKVRMLVSGIFGHMDFFINGKRLSWQAKVFGKGAGDNEMVTVEHLDLGSAWSWNYNETFDIEVGDYLQYGEVNTVVVRTRDMWRWGGIFKRVQFYTPIAEPSPPAQPIARCDCSK